MAGVKANQSKPPQPHNRTHTVLIWILMMSFPRAWLSMTMSTADGRWTFHRRRTTATTGSGNHVRYFLTVGGMQTTPAATRTNPTTTTATQQQGKKPSPADLHAGRTESLCPQSTTMPTQWLTIRPHWSFVHSTVVDRLNPSQAHYHFTRFFTGLTNPARRTKMWDTPGSHFRESPANRRLSITRKNTCDTITRVVYWTLCST